MRFYLICVGVLGAIAVAAGALTAHGLPKILESRGVPTDEIPQRVEWAESAIRYQFLHTLALLGTVAIGLRYPSSGSLRLAAAAFILGMLLFSGSLLALGWTGNRVFARIAPWGGTTLIVAWLILAWAGWTLPGGSSE